MTVAEGTLEATKAPSRPVLVPLDGSALAERALPWAAALAEHRHAPLLLVRAVSPYVTVAPDRWTEPDSVLSQDVMAAEENEAYRYLEKQAEMLGLVAPALSVRRAVPAGDAADEVLRLAAAQGAQLIVLTTHGRTGLVRWVRGSVAEKLLRYGSLPLLLIRPWEHEPAAAKDRWRGRRVLVPLDGSALAEHVLPEATRLTAGAGGEVVLATVVRPNHDQDQDSRPARALATASRDHARTYLHGVARRHRQQGARVRSVVLVAADIVRALTEHAVAEDADVIAMGTHGRGGIGRFVYGSVADQVAHRAPVPVLLVRPPAAAAARLVEPLTENERETVAPRPAATVPEGAPP
jgi:nucleotide-binding universal stress UspA family protein